MSTSRAMAAIGWSTRWSFGGTSGGFIDARTLPADGTYTLVVDPQGTATGSATLTLYDVPPDASGSIVPETLKGAAILSPASAPLGKVSLRDRDAVVTDMTGTALTYVTPATDPAVAGVFGVPSLDAAEQLAIYMYWSR